MISVLVFVSRDFEHGRNVSAKSRPAVPHGANLFHRNVLIAVHHFTLLSLVKQNHGNEKNGLFCPDTTRNVA